MGKAEDLRHTIARDIAATGLPAGERFGTRSGLAKHHGVAPATLNEALRLLVADGLVTLKPGPGGGVLVASQTVRIRIGGRELVLRGSESEMAENLETRYLLMAAVARSAARNRDISQHDIDALAGQLQLLEADVKSDTDLQLSVWRLQRMIAEQCTNTLLRTIYIGLLDTAANQLVDVVFTRPRKRNRVELHVKLVAAVIDGDVTTAHEVATELTAFTLGDVTDQES